MPKKSFLYIFQFLFVIFFSWLLISLGFKYLSVIIISFCIALILNPLVKKMEKILNCKRKSSTFLVIIFILSIFIICSVMLIQFLIQEISILIETFPNQMIQIEKLIENIIAKLPIEFSLTTITKNLNIGEYVSKITSGLFSITQQLPDLLIKFIFICLFSFFFILNMEKIKETIKTKIIPQSINLGNEFKGIILGYFKAQIKIFFIMSILLCISFLILKIPYSFLLALLVAFLDSLPVFGTGTVLIPYAVIELFSKNFFVGIGLLVIYLGTQVVRRIIEPKILGKTIGLSTFSSVLFLFLGYQFGGAIGLILGIPIGVILKYFYQLGIFNPFFFHCLEIKKWLQEGLMKTKEE